MAPQAPWTGSIVPWTLNSSDQFRPEPPPELDSETWVRDYNEVKALGPGTGSTRIAEQTNIGRFWADQPMLQWNRAWRGISIGAGLSVQDNARLFAMLATASSDALIACWEAKYHYMFWRRSPRSGPAAETRSSRAGADLRGPNRLVVLFGQGCLTEVRE